MTSVFFDISVSLDGFAAGPDASLEHPLGAGGEGLHEWALASMAWRESHGHEGGDAGADSDIVQATIDRAGAHIMGRNMFSGGFTDSWEDDPRATGWWGDEPPFGKPVFVLTHHPREPLTLGATTFTFVTDGPEAALAAARVGAGRLEGAGAAGPAVRGLPAVAERAQARLGEPGVEDPVAGEGRQPVAPGARRAHAAARLSSSSSLACAR